MSDEKDLLKLAESIADGRPVDWLVAGEIDESSRRRVEGMRILESIAAVHRLAPEGAGRVVPMLEGIPASLDPGQTWGSLTIIEKLGETRCSSVYRAHDPELSRDVALKLTRLVSPGPETDERSLEEARTLARVRHPNVLIVHGVRSAGGLVGLWTELLSGKTLEQYLSEQGPLSAREAAVIGIELCRALAAIHAAGITHRDIKTTNVMREAGGRIVLMDFGAATGLTVPGGSGEPQCTAGSPIYMAPELLRGGRPGVATDIYSVGVLLYRITTGRYPFPASRIEELIELQARGGVVRLRDVRPDIPARFVRVVERAMDADPARRYRSAGALEADLSGILDVGGATPAAPAAPAVNGISRTPWWRRRTALMLFSAGILVALFYAGRPLLDGNSFNVAATLYREAPGLAQPISSGARVQPGDRLFLEFTGSKPLHVYVLNEDDQGNAYLLFPIPGVSPANPLSPGVRYKLPGVRQGVQQTWEVDSYGGRETLLFVASREPLDDIETQLERFSRPVNGTPGVYAPLDRGVSHLFRGIGRLAPVERSETEGSRGRVAAISRKLGVTSGNARKIWVEEIQLENPGP